jgi:hypothetical protein
MEHPDHGLETAQLLKRIPAENARLAKRLYTSSTPHGPAVNCISTSAGDEICNTYQSCRYTHVCTICEGSHPAMRYTQK